MKVKFIRDEEFTQETWLNENEKGQVITIHKGETFKTGAWGYGGIESVLTDKGEWVCDCDCQGFDELFEVIKDKEIIGQERYWKADTNHERFRIEKFDGECDGVKCYIVKYFETNNREQIHTEQSILEKSILIEPEFV